MRKEGNNPYYNKVYVDFNKKTIKFIPIERKKIIKYYVSFLLGIIVIYLYGILLPYYLIGAIITIFNEGLYPLINFIGIILMLQLLLMSIYFSLSYWNKKWRQHNFPEFSKRIAVFIKKLSTFGLYKVEKIRLNKEAIIDKKFLLPQFNNMYLKYNITKDFSKQLKNIRIVNTFKQNNKFWFCLFEFYKKPKDGNLIIEYV